MCGYDIKQRACSRELRISKFEENARKLCDTAVKLAHREQLQAITGGVTLSTWESLRRAFKTRLVVYELQRRNGYYMTFSSIHEPGLQKIMMEMLATESRFGGVLSEELVREVRIVYPHVSRQLLPRTAMQRARECCEVSGDRSFQTTGTLASVNNHSNIGTTHDAFEIDSCSTWDSGVSSTMHSAGTISSSPYVPVPRHVSLKGISDYVNGSGQSGIFLYDQLAGV